MRHPVSPPRLPPRRQVRFLEYIRQWQKKVVFVVNKADILDSVDEVEAVKDFVAENAQRILRLDRPSVIAVSPSGRGSWSGGTVVEGWEGALVGWGVGGRVGGDAGGAKSVKGGE